MDAITRHAMASLTQHSKNPTFPFPLGSHETFNNRLVCALSLFTLKLLYFILNAPRHRTKLRNENYNATPSPRYVFIHTVVCWPPSNLISIGPNFKSVVNTSFIF